jgi:beta-xylosidase
MVEAVMLWNEPNNLSHWDFHLDPDWRKFAEMVLLAASAIRKVNPDLKIVLGGISPIDPKFMELMGSYGVLDAMDVVASAQLLAANPYGSQRRECLRLALKKFKLSA